MIYSNSLQHKFIELNLTEYSEDLERYIKNTFLLPNEINVNPISLDTIKESLDVVKEIYSQLTPSDITSDLHDLFVILYNKPSELIKNSIQLISKTRFLQLLVCTYIYGMIVECKDLPSLQNNPFQL